MRDEILKRYPYLAEVPPDAPEGKDSPLPPPPPISWDGLGTVIPVNPPPPPPPTPEGETATSVNVNSIADATQQPVVDVLDSHSPSDNEDSHGIEEDDNLTTWHDVALSIAAGLMDKMRHDIHTKLGYTMTSVCPVFKIDLAICIHVTIHRVSREISFLPRYLIAYEYPDVDAHACHKLTASYKKPNNQVLPNPIVTQFAC